MQTLGVSNYYLSRVIRSESFSQHSLRSLQGSVDPEGGDSLEVDDQKCDVKNSRKDRASSCEIRGVMKVKVQPQKCYYSAKSKMEDRRLVQSERG